MKPNLDLMHPALREHALKELEAGNVIGFLGSAKGGNTDWLGIVLGNLTVLKEQGLYEKALLQAFTGCRVNNHHWPPHMLAWLFAQADRARLREAGDPLPGPGPFTLYRGVAGRGAGRRVRGLSWTASLDRARSFATRLPLDDPAVFQVTVDESDVLAYVNGRQEEEFLVRLAPNARPIRIESCSIHLDSKLNP
jgi:hypothetical protein